ncbi:hypothetical protein [Candidatus Roseilinea sp. NK_OTU-006]|jgi:hypothetical protein|uniref:hypothetical protein n=1 Tax=Candidatus Roseilinea sp. NK_OTU-006 TaxID=2704250 RepID=UPI00145E0346|nr:hypothetical protein [Candidatus Roseilinea sp. NK_OTU-006]
MALLDDSELRVVLFACRHIYGWRETNSSGSAVLSLSVFEHGQRGSSGCGLSRPAIIAALDSLERFGVMKRLGEATQKGQRWALVDDDQLIDWAGLEGRAENRQHKRRRSGQVVKPLNHQSSHFTSGQATLPAVKPVDQGWLNGLTTGGKATLPGVVNQLNHIETHIETQNQKPISETQQQQAPAAPASAPTAAQPSAPAADGVGGAAESSRDEADDLAFILPAVRRLHLSAEAQERLLALGAQQALAIAFAATAKGVRNPAGLAVKLMDNGGASEFDLERAALALELRTLKADELDRHQHRREYERLAREAAERASVWLAQSKRPVSSGDDGLDYRPGGGPLTLRQWWQAVLEDWERRAGHPLKPAVPLRFADGVLTVQVGLANLHWWQVRVGTVGQTLSRWLGEPVRLEVVLSDADRAARERFEKLKAEVLGKRGEPSEAPAPVVSQSAPEPEPGEGEQTDTAPEPPGAAVARMVAAVVPPTVAPEPVVQTEPVTPGAEAEPEPDSALVAVADPGEPLPPPPPELDPAGLPGLWQQTLATLREQELPFSLAEISRLQVAGYEDGVVLLRAATAQDYQWLEGRGLTLGYVQNVLRRQAGESLQIRLLPPDVAVQEQQA